MKKKIFTNAFLTLSFLTSYAQNLMTPESLWKLGRVSPEMVTEDHNLIYGVTYYDLEANKSERNIYSVPLNGGEPKQITKTAGSESNVMIAPNGKLGYLYKGQYWEANPDGTNAKQI
ncbi:MAG: S9 family peptidase, partial [Chitinophagales bacterium]